MLEFWRLFDHTVVTITQLKRTSGNSLAFLKNTTSTLQMLRDVQLMMTIIHSMVATRAQIANHLWILPLLKNLNKEAHTLTRNQRTLSSNEKAPTFSLAKHLSNKWTTGTGPRIGCVRDYPTELQFRALEQVNLSARVANVGFNFSGPIPSPRPSPKIRLSPRIAHMGLPSPRTPISAPN